MKSHRFWLAFVFVLPLSLVFAFVLSSLMMSGTAAPAPNENSSFKGKLVYVTVVSQHSILLENAHVRKLGDEYFLVGKGDKEGVLPTTWIKDRVKWIPFKQIEEVVEFDNVEQIKQASDEWDKAHPPEDKKAQP